MLIEVEVDDDIVLIVNDKIDEAEVDDDTHMYEHIIEHEYHDNEIIDDVINIHIHDDEVVEHELYDEILEVNIIDDYDELENVVVLVEHYNGMRDDDEVEIDIDVVTITDDVDDDDIEVINKMHVIMQHIIDEVEVDMYIEQYIDVDINEYLY